jgi:phosphopantetheinyl transferase (holo-ACP synthase)
MPLAMSIEILAEAAACLLPGLAVVGLRDVRGQRWLAWDEAPRTLEVAARRLEPDGAVERVAVALRELDEAGAPADPPAVEGIVLLAATAPPAPAPLAPDLSGARAPRHGPDRLYADVMFHGPLWRGVRAMELVAPAGARARLAILPPDGMLRSTPAPAFVLDPVALDAAGQVIGFWAAETLERARVVFPFHLAALDLHGPAPPPGAEVDCTAQIALQGDGLVRSDIAVADATGAPWMRLTGWADRRFDVPDALRPLTRPGPLDPLSQPWPAPLAALDGLDAACRRLDTRLPDAGLWAGAWSRRVLGRAERARFDALELPAARRLEWLGARTAAKEAVAALLRDRYGLDLRPADIEITAGERGAPRVAAPGLDVLPVEPVVSLTHTAGRAAALAALVPRGRGVGLGIDAERVGPRPAGFAEAALAADERRLLGHDDAAAVRGWCAKEAAGKALGAGIAARPAIVAADPAGRLVVEAGGRRLDVATLREGDLVVAVAHTEPGEAP